MAAPFWFAGPQSVGKGCRAASCQSLDNGCGLWATAVAELTPAVIPITRPEALRRYIYTISGVLAAF